MSILSQAQTGLQGCRSRDSVRARLHRKGLLCGYGDRHRGHLLILFCHSVVLGTPWHSVDAQSFCLISTVSQAVRSSATGESSSAPRPLGRKKEKKRRKQRKKTKKTPGPAIAWEPTPRQRNTIIHRRYEQLTTGGHHRSSSIRDSNQNTQHRRNVSRLPKHPPHSRCVPLRRDS